MESTVFVNEDYFTDYKGNFPRNNKDTKLQPKWRKSIRVQSSVKDTIINTKPLAKMCGIPPRINWNVIKKTNQSTVKRFDWPRTQSFHTQKKMSGNQYMNTTAYNTKILSSVKSVYGDTCAQVFITHFYDVAV